MTGRPLLNRIGPSAIRSGYVAGAVAAGRFKRMGGILNPVLGKVLDAYHARVGLGPASASASEGPSD